MVERHKGREKEREEEKTRQRRSMRGEKDEPRRDERDPVLVATDLFVLVEEVRDVHLAVGVVPRLSKGDCSKERERARKIK